MNSFNKSAKQRLMKKKKLFLENLFVNCEQISNDYE